MSVDNAFFNSAYLSSNYFNVCGIDDSNQLNQYLAQMHVEKLSVFGQDTEPHLSPSGSGQGLAWQHVKCFGHH